MINSNCPFCSPLADKASFAESENFKALYNLAPILPGHILIVPRLHVASFLEVGEEHMMELIVFSRKLIRFLKKEFNADGFDFTIQDGKSAGQTITHMHAHIVPRHDGDMPNPGDWYPAVNSKQTEMLDSILRERLTDSEMNAVITHLKASFLRF